MIDAGDFFSAAIFNGALCVASIFFVGDRPSAAVVLLLTNAQ
jgi:hypothetical protein